MKEWISDKIDLLKEAILLIKIARQSKKSMAKKLGHKISWMAWLQYFIRTVNKVNEKTIEYGYLLNEKEKISFSNEILKEELCIDLVSII